MVIDTSIIIEYIRASDKSRTAFAAIAPTTPVSVSAVTICELLMGATDEIKKNDVYRAIRGIPVQPFNEEIAVVATHIYLSLRRKSQLIEFRDIFIAATAIHYQVPLKTLNISHFSRIEGLILA